MKVLVEYGQSRKVKDVENAVVTESLCNSLCVIMNIPFSIADLCFQYFDDDFQTWVDLEIGTQMTDKFKIKVFPHETSLAMSDTLNNMCDKSPSSKDSSACLSDPESESSLELKVGLVDLEGVVDLTSSPQNVASTSTEKQKPEKAGNYSRDDVMNNNESQLPCAKFSKGLQNKLQKEEQLQWGEKHELLNHIGDFLYGKTKYPNMEMKRHIAKQLIMKYPYLKERIGSGHDAWTTAIDNKMKSMRMKDPSLQLKKASPTKRKGHAKGNIVKKPCKREINFLPPIPSTEDETSLKKHQETMKKEMSKKGVKNIILLETLMDKTYPQRRAYVTTKPLVKDFFQSYPALMLAEEMNNEMKRLTGIDGEQKLKSFPRLAKSITTLGRIYMKNVKSGDKCDKIKDIIHRYDRVTRSSEVENECAEEGLKAAVMLLPLLLREKEDDFVKYTECPWPFPS